MNKYTLSDLSVIFESRHYLTRDRFIHYFTLRYGYSEKEAEKAFELFYKFPRLLNGSNDIDATFLDGILTKAIELVREMKASWSFRLENLAYSTDDKRKLVFKEHEALKECVLNLHNPMDIVTYADLIPMQRYRLSRTTI